MAHLSAPKAPSQIIVLSHPLIQHKLTHMRMETTDTGQFRRLAEEIAMLLVYEVTRDLPLTFTSITTPLMPMQAPLLRDENLALVSIMRAGNAMLDGMLKLLPSAHVGHIGIARDPKTHETREYYFKVPDGMHEREVIVVDPMLATGHSAALALSRLKGLSPKSVKFVCLVAAPEGLTYLHNAHPEVRIYCAQVDQSLNDKAYIIPGLGDAGDRMFGTV